MNIQNIVDITGLSKRMIRHYEELGLIKPHRNINNYREYSDSDLTTSVRKQASKVIVIQYSFKNVWSKQMTQE